MVLDIIINMNAFILDFEKKVKDSIKKYDLIIGNERIAVAISGGKDSTSLLYLLKKFGCNVFALFIDLKIKGNSDENLKRITAFCKKNCIELRIVDLKKEAGHSLLEICRTYQKEHDSTNCAICGAIKRHYLNKFAKKWGADKLATGHNLDDEAENLLLNIFSNNYDLCFGLGPGSVKDDVGLFIPRIKPLYDCLNSETEKYSRLMGFDIYPEICPLRADAFRKDVRHMISKIKNNDFLKRKLVNNFLDILKKMPAKKFLGAVKCFECSEPSRKGLCKACEILKFSKKR